jgi:hypothetical protein
MTETQKDIAGIIQKSAESTAADLGVRLPAQGNCVKSFLRSCLSRKFAAVLIFGVYAYLVLMRGYNPPDSVTTWLGVIVTAYAGIEGIRDLKGQCPGGGK